MARRRPNIPKLARKGDLAGLCEALRFRDGVIDRQGVVLDVGIPVRVAAVEAIADMDEPGALDALLVALEDPAVPVRIAAVRALGARSGPEAAAALTRLLLREPRDPAAAEAEAEFASHPSAGADLTARVYLEHGGSDAALGALLDGGLVGEQVLTDAVTALGADDPEIGRRARVLVSCQGPHALLPLLRTAYAGGADETICELLGALRDPRALDTLIGALGSPDPAVRRSAASALGEIRDPRAHGALLPLLADPDYEVRVAAQTAARAMGSPPEVPAFSLPALTASAVAARRGSPAWAMSLRHLAEPWADGLRRSLLAARELGLRARRFWEER